MTYPLLLNHFVAVPEANNRNLQMMAKKKQISYLLGPILHFIFLSRFILSCFVRYLSGSIDCENINVLLFINMIIIITIVPASAIAFLFLFHFFSSRKEKKIRTDCLFISSLRGISTEMRPIYIQVCSEAIASHGCPADDVMPTSNASRLKHQQLLAFNFMFRIPSSLMFACLSRACAA